VCASIKAIFYVSDVIAKDKVLFVQNEEVANIYMCFCFLSLSTENK